MGYNMIVMKTVLICPKNDEESLMIHKLAVALQVPVLTSRQPHGARLEKEKNLVERIRKVNPEAKRLVIVELPGPAVEAQLRQAGYSVKIIDHHRYDDVSRMKKKSSLEQILDEFKLDNRRLKQLGFDPKMVRAVGAIDRGFVWELKKEPLSKAERQQALKFYRALTHELGSERRAKEERAALLAWKKRQTVQGIVVVKSPDDRVSVRDALSFLVAEEIGQPTTLVIFQGTRRVYVQETSRAKKLHEHFGGFTFGQDRCWGLLATPLRALPKLDEVLRIVVK